MNFTDRRGTGLPDCECLLASDVLTCPQVDEGELVPLLVAAGGGGKAYLEDPESCQDQVPLEKYEKDTLAPSTNGVTGAAGTHSSPDTGLFRVFMSTILCPRHGHRH